MLSSLGFIGSGSRVMVPDVVGMSSGTAISTIEGVGLVAVNGGTTSSGATSQNNGTVASQSPAVSQVSKPDLERGGSVTYVTYSYSPPVSYPPVWTDNQLSNSFVVGVPYSDAVSATNMNYSGSYSVTSGSLPAGISLNSSTGAVTGTPSVAGAYSFTITAQNSYGSISASFSGGVSGGGAVSIGVNFDTPSSQSSLSGNVFVENLSGSSITITLTASAGSVSPTSFIVNTESVVNPSFVITGLSAGQTVTLVASGGGASGSDTATTTGSSGSLTSASVAFDAASSTSQLTGTASFVNNTGATYSISLSSSAGSISPSSFVAGPYSAPGSPTTTSQVFTVTGLSANQTITVSLSGGGASASSSAATLSSTASYNYTFTYGLGTQTVPSGSEFVNSGSVYTSTSQNVTVDTNSPKGSQTFFAYTSGTWYWLVYRTLQ